ncbi:ammonia-dependent NAD(+) synthetase [Alcaligenes endophyticus]|uniref:NH(3)-dependent NAD(+) synthetase n=1 Tax=Alcaligenes endophyticus TaxID=1929088 RepID=A0ABT8EGA3_9BURK|nr:ammonia-dependent NAD(+) synthetase [Alcaligenes endophyticus]MCX5590016.1 ammonia-dependent NAD(+) synthetase [Alcaligenes endophyticus]MDN4120321.1 ammonia-dependent NAD(+) synthetase [Alcaligenes endophyticus]
MTEDRLRVQQEIRQDLGVTEEFDVQAELDKRIAFLQTAMRNTRCFTLVLGVSGGVDSLVAGCLAQRAVAGLRAQGQAAQFIAVRLPYGVQADEQDAQGGLQVIQPDQTLVVNVQPATDAMLVELLHSGLQFRDAAHQDFLVGNIKARQRMVAQYAIAGAHAGLVVGTDHAAEALMGFFTKYGDGAADLMPLGGLNKRRVRALGTALGASHALVYKVPTADLESLTPLKPDEEAFGVTYEQIDDFLEGKAVPNEAAEIIIRTYYASAHKRAVPPVP